MAKASPERVTPGPAEEWIEGRYEEAQSVLRDHWGEVRKLAVALIDHRRLDRDDLWRLLD